MSLITMLQQIEQTKKELDSLRPLSVEAEQKLWKKFRLEWDYNSNHIEGNTLTYGETVLLLINGKTTGDHEVREYEEMKAHDLAIHEVKEWAQDKERDLSEADVRQLNKTILKEPFWKEAITEDGQPTRRLIKIGEYKEFPNSVRLATGEMFHYATPTDTPQLMKELMEWYRANKELHPAVLAAELHYRFICIHPFDDGNGRVARLMVNFVLMQNGYPPIIIKSDDKKGYLTALQKADANDREAFHQYISAQLQWSLELELKAAKGENIEENDDWKKQLDLLKRELPKEDDLKESYSDTTCHRVCLEVLYPLYSKVIKEMGEFDVLFKKRDVTLQMDNTMFQIVNEKGLLNKLSETNERYTRVNLEIRFGGFTKNGIDVFDLNGRIECNFENHRYTVSIPDGERHNITKFYHQNIMDEEQNYIISKMAEKFLTNINSRTKLK